MRKIYPLIAVLLVIALGFVGWWRSGDQREATRGEFIMGTYIEARAYGRRAEAALDAVYARLAEIEQRMSINLADSEISQVNQQAGSEPVQVSADTFEVVQQALRFAELTGGKFDPTIQPVVSLWKIGSPEARVPTPEEIGAYLAFVDYHLIELNAKTKSIFLPLAGMGLDLGGIAKGYAADEAVTIMRQYGIRNGIISLGGNLYAIGQNPAGDRPWRIGVQDPEDTRNTYVAVLEPVDETMVTSGAYERYLIADGKVYHHIIDPDTGYPAETDVLSSTIVATSSIDADALSTSVFILGREQGMQLIESLPGIEAVVIDKEHRVYVTTGLKNRVSVLNERYQLVP
ncbi:MAG: FAD:protein FMN transferase [Bacillota bacterium]|jgi:thiamine biosynthesis lipoprotein